MVPSRFLVSAVFTILQLDGPLVAIAHQIRKKSAIRKHRSSKSKFASFLQRKEDPIQVFSQPAYGTGGEACCACYFARKRTPERMGLAATFANALTCDTCYVADVHDIDAVDRVMAGVKAAGQVGDDSSTYDSVQGARGVKFDTTAKSLKDCKANCEANPDCGVFAFFDRDAECHLVMPSDAMPAIWASPSENMFQDFFPGIRYYKKGGMIPANPTTAFNIVHKSKKVAVSEWNWACVPGVAPTDAASWTAPMVDGEPPSRKVYHLCDEKEYFCESPGGDQDDLMVGLPGLPTSEVHWDKDALGDVDPYALEGLLPKLSRPWDPEDDK